MREEEEAGGEREGEREMMICLLLEKMKLKRVWEGWKGR
jgi:hypothetical protein